MIVPLSSGWPFAAPSAFDRAVRSMRSRLSGGASLVSTTASTPRHRPGPTEGEIVEPTVIGSSPVVTVVLPSTSKKALTKVEGAFTVSTVAVYVLVRLPVLQIRKRRVTRSRGPTFAEGVDSFGVTVRVATATTVSVTVSETVL